MNTIHFLNYMNVFVFRRLMDEVRINKMRQINKRMRHLIHRYVVPLPLKGKSLVVVASLVSSPEIVLHQLSLQGLQGGCFVGRLIMPSP